MCGHEWWVGGESVFYRQRIIFHEGCSPDFKSFAYGTPIQVHLLRVLLRIKPDGMTGDVPQALVTKLFTYRTPIPIHMSWVTLRATPNRSCAFHSYQMTCRSPRAPAIVPFASGNCRSLRPHYCSTLTQSLSLRG